MRLPVLQRRTSAEQKFCAGELLHIGNFVALAAYPHMWSKCMWNASIGVSMWISTVAGAGAGAGAGASCPWLGSVGGEPGLLAAALSSGPDVVVVVDVAVPPVPLAIFGVAVTGMVPCARPLTEVAVATVVAVPT